MIKLLIVAFSFFNSPIAKDSVGLETINGKVFIIHKVEGKETLYGISKRYSTTVDAITEYNPSVTGGLEIGQLLKVPYTRPATTGKSPTKSSGNVIHVVAEKETLFSISRAYNVSVEDLKQWNNLPDNSLSRGQELVIKNRNVHTAPVVNSPTTTVTAPSQMKSKKGTHTVAAGETMFSIARQNSITVQQLKEWNSLLSNELSVGQVLFLEEPEHGIKVTQQTPTPVIVKDPANVKQEPAAKEPKEIKPPQPQPKETTITISEAVKGSDEILESGIAELIEGTDGNRKYLALHRTAPIGTILKVKNEMNNREVFVRVMGKLPETALTDKVIIRVSKSAYDRLGAIDQKFRVQVTYYK